MSIIGLSFSQVLETQTNQTYPIPPSWNSLSHSNSDSGLDCFSQLSCGRGICKETGDSETGVLWEKGWKEAHGGDGRKGLSNFHFHYIPGNRHILPSFDGSNNNLPATQETQFRSLGQGGKSPEEGNAYSLQDSCPENPTDRGAWQASIHWVANSWTQMSN